MQQTKRNIVTFIVLGAVFILGLGGAAFYYLQNKADASVIGNDGTVCPQYISADPSSCTDGAWVTSTPNANGCPQPPKCVTTRTVSPSITVTTACSAVSPVAGASVSPCIAPPTTTPTTCPELVPMVPEWCSDGTIQTQPNDANGCPQAPKCIRDKVTYNLSNGFNLIVVPEYMYSLTNPISSSSFSGMTMYSYTNGNWQINPTYLRQNGSYLVRNRDNDKSVTIKSTGLMLVGAQLDQEITKGWNMVANNSDSPKLLSELQFRTYITNPDCQTPPFCSERKTLAELFGAKRMYSRIFFFNDLTSSDPNTFYATKILRDADLANYKIPARSGFWLYLYQ